MKAVFISKPMELADAPNTTTSEIHIFTQFFIHKKDQRNEEIRHCLLQNQNNQYVYKIHLLNERLYTLQELGLTVPHKIHQENIGKRLSFQSVFQYIRENNIKGYCVMLNSDIFLDNSIKYILTSALHEKKQAMALLRYEYNNKKPVDQSPIFGPRFDSQDTWIFHSNFLVSESQEKVFAFDFGRPGCDNKVVYLLNVLGYTVFNDPRIIRTYHYHRSIMRDYQAKDALPQPWGAIVPSGTNVLTIPPSLGINLGEVCKTTSGFRHTMFHDNNALYDYVDGKIQRGEKFVIPRIAGIENNFAVFANIKKQSGATNFDQYFQQVGPAMKNNAGILLTTMNSIMKYSEMYLKVFENCEMYSGWEIQGEVYKHIAQSHDFINNSFQGKQQFWALALDIFHYVHDPKAWTKSLRGKRILVVSPFVDSIRAKIAKRAQLYDGVDLFPDCTFVFIKPPMTQAGEPSREFDVELQDFTRRLDAIRNDYDVALVSCGGYGNLVCNYIYEAHNKSAVYVGGVLQMYFGVLGGRWLKERSDVVRLFLNEHWSRPTASERPVNCDTIEKACYW